MRKKTGDNKKIFFVLACAAVLCFFALKLYGMPTDSRAYPLEVTFIDVGQGDSALIMFPDGKTALIDAGESAGEKKVLQALRQNGVTRLDYVVATHPHSDHIGGLAAVIERFEVGRVFMPKAEHNTNTYKNLLGAIKKKGLKVETARAEVVMAQEEEYKAVFVAPCKEEYGDLNDWSAVLHLTFGDTAFLFTGDAGEQSENEIYANTRADVLKVGHHGSKTATSDNFLYGVSPRIAVISCGRGNSYGHPHGEVLERLRKNGIIVLRTDEEGDIVIGSDGKEVRIKK